MVERLRAELARHARGQQRPHQQPEQHRLAARHFHHHHAGRQRRLRGRRQESRHRHEHQHALVHALARELPDMLAYAGASRQRGREDATRNARPIRRDGSRQLGQAEAGRRAVLARQQVGRHAVPGAVNTAGRAQADHRQHQTHDEGRPDGMRADPGAPGGRCGAGCAFAEQPREDAAQRAVDGAANDDPHHHAMGQRRPAEHAEVRVVALHRHHQEARGQHADQHQALPAQHGAAAQLFDGEDDAGKRRIEGSGKPARGAGGDQFIGMEAAQLHATTLPEIAPGQHERGAHLHRRAFAPDRRAGQHAEERQRNLP
ncbi:hypothetical protein D3C72_886560 [compost metagenome]